MESPREEADPNRSPGPESERASDRREGGSKEREDRERSRESRSRRRPRSRSYSPDRRRVRSRSRSPPRRYRSRSRSRSPYDRRYRDDYHRDDRRREPPSDRYGRYPEDDYRYRDRGPPPPHDSRGQPPPRRDRERRRGRDEGPPGVSLLIRNISRQVTSEDLRTAFEKIGEIKDVYIPLDYHTQEPRGFAFIEYASAAKAAEAREEMDRFPIKGQELEVVFAQERRKSPHEMRRRGGPAPRRGDRSRDRPRRERSSSFERHRQREREERDRAQGQGESRGQDDKEV